jgi:RNA polymerase sigma factor (TIGR02999 family)
VIQRAKGEAVPEVQMDQVTQLLQQWARGDEKALAILVPLVYQELRRLAHHHLRAEPVDHTLQSTALVNEAFLRLNGGNPVRLQDRSHFLAIASRAMRQILVDYARSRQALKRDGGVRITLDAALEIPMTGAVEFVALDVALERLATLDEKQAKIVEMKFFGGLVAQEIAEALDISLATVERKWATARIWLRREMKGFARR